MAETTRSHEPAKESAWAPLRVKAFRALWLAQVGSAIGTWMQTVGAQWLLVGEPGAATLVALVQVAAMLPVLLLALPAGLWPTRGPTPHVDRDPGVPGVCRGGPGGAHRGGAHDTRPSVDVHLPYRLRDRADPACISSADPGPRPPCADPFGDGIRRSRGERGPCGGARRGWPDHRSGRSGAVFALNALSFVVFCVVLVVQRRPAAAVEAAPERLASAIRAGGRYVRNSPAVRRMLLRVGLFVLPGAALWALLPLVASQLLRTGSTGYGVLLERPEAGHNNLHVLALTM